ncbi:MAG: DUF5652 family protein [Patescibacteria group bacterium]|nr:DUF5652 family protein [Patescibacteria group bacterium]
MTEQDIINFLESGWGVLTLTVFIIWSLIWEGLALWKAAQRKDKVWFIVLLLTNTLGTLELIYYLFIGKEKKK